MPFCSRVPEMLEARGNVSSCLVCCCDAYGEETELSLPLACAAQHGPANSTRLTALGKEGVGVPGETWHHL